jgi:transposase InsO family protein
MRAIEDIHKASRGTYGSPRILAELKGLGFKCSKSRVERLMKKYGIRAKTRRKFRVTTDSKHSLPVAPNVLDRDFSPEKPNAAWGGDITYVWTKEGWLFLAVIIDLYSRQVVGWSMDERMTRELTLSALRMAINRRKPGQGLIHHTDRGSQYASADYRRLLKAHDMICSMSRKGNCWDNAPIESFFHTLKTECIYWEEFETREEARRKIFEWIEVFYNRQRRHSTLGNLSPVNFEIENWKLCA